MADAVGTVDAGADLIGVACDNDRSVVEDCSIEETRAIFAAVEQRCLTIALSLGTDVDRIVRMVAATRPKILHLAARELPLPVLEQLRQRIAPVKLMVAVLVDGPGAVDVARARAYADYIILDSGSSKEAVTGATGRTHDGTSARASSPRRASRWCWRADWRPTSPKRCASCAPGRSTRSRAPTWRPARPQGPRQGARLRPQRARRRGAALGTSGAGGD
ncbi:MAG: hypothetical protein U1F30_07810 [Steroidobacteraceae bacterium]